MPFAVSTSDIEQRWRPLTDAEQEVAFRRLADAQVRLRIARPGLDAAYTALVAGPLKSDVLEMVRMALSEAVIRFIRNPDQTVRQDIGADGSIGIGFDTNTAGGVYISDDDLAAIDNALAHAQSVAVRSRGRSIGLVSTFPWRRTPADPTILPTP